MSESSQHDQFWSQVYKTDYCWFWIGHTEKNGYGAFSVKGNRPLAAHRYAYQEINGKIPDGLNLHHECEIRNCVNPSHLTPLTPAQHRTQHAFPKPDYRPEVRYGNQKRYAAAGANQ